MHVILGIWTLHSFSSSWVRLILTLWNLILRKDSYILEHQVRISEIYLGIENLILPRLSRKGYIHCCSSSDFIVMFKWRHHVNLHRSVFRDFWKLILKLKKSWARKWIHYLCEGKIDNLSSGSPFVITRQALWCQKVILETNFYPTLTLMIDSYIIWRRVSEWNNAMQ